MNVSLSLETTTSKDLTVEQIRDEYNYEGVPIMASNMDGVGTFEMADVLARQHIFTCLVKTYLNAVS